MKEKRIILPLIACLLLTACSSDAPSRKEGARLEAGFATPPSEARPRVWWHWMNGNVTKDGIRKDLEWMESVGIAGFQVFDAALQTPAVVKERLVYMTPEWKEAFAYTASLAAEKGMEMAIAGSPGWSESGGPWVKPEQAMKKVVWSELDIKGGSPVSVTLPLPPTQTGNFQSVPMSQGGMFSNATAPSPTYYKDVAVIAMKLPEGYSSLDTESMRVSSSGGKFTPQALSDGDYTTAVSNLPYGKPGAESWIQYEFAAPQTIYGVEVATLNQRGRGGSKPARLQVSDDGVNFQDVATLSEAAEGVSATAFEGTTGKIFRLTYVAPSMDFMPPMGFPGMWGAPPVSPKGIDVAEFKLFNLPRVDRYIEKAGFTVATNLASSPTREKDGVKKTDILDITDKMKEDGTLQWTPDEGAWKILRFGYSLTGRTNHPASPEATGLEVDKLSAEHTEAYFTHYLDMYKDAAAGILGEKGLQYVITDSWEAGCLNWTDLMFEDFSSMRGYDLHAWLPAIAGYIVESGSSSDKVLWDYRKTIGELLAKNHYDLLTDLLKRYGMGRYSESHENGRAFVGDGMEMKRSAAVPMSAMWAEGLGQSGADIRESASVSHIYGQKYTAAESLTSGGNAWGYVPEMLKPTADWLMANGLNRFVIHTSVHQPLDDYKPGFSLGPFGQWFTRHETWSGAGAKAWIDYLSRSSFLLQQGTNHADILYFYGEGKNITAQYGNSLPAIPRGYNFDFVNADAILHVIGVKDGRITAPSGTSYSLIYLDPDNTADISLPVLKKLYTLVENGAILVGAKPTASPSLEDDTTEFDRLVSAMWTGLDEISLGKGRIFATRDMAQALSSLGVKKEIDYAGEERLSYVHRSSEGVEIYWILNRDAKACQKEISFGVKGLRPEIWSAVDGSIVPASYRIEGDRTLVPLNLEAQDAVFVIFRSKASSDHVTIPAPGMQAKNLLPEGWTVSFLSGMGAPESTRFESLSDWSLSDDPAIRYYSGTASYKNHFNLPSKDGQIILDLGEVHDIAEVLVNGKTAGTLWKAPFRLDITDAVWEGENEVEIRITNMWVNRLIGDLQPGAQKYTKTNQHSYTAASPLKPSGLLGPVSIDLLK